MAQTEFDVPRRRDLLQPDCLHELVLLCFSLIESEE